jgi:hypothetical protein
MFVTYYNFLPIPWSRFLLDMVTGSQLVKKFPAFYVFIIAFTRVFCVNIS